MTIHKDDDGHIRIVAINGEYRPGRYADEAAAIIAERLSDDDLFGLADCYLPITVKSMTNQNGVVMGQSTGGFPGTLQQLFSYNELIRKLDAVVGRCGTATPEGEDLSKIATELRGIFTLKSK